MKKSYRVFKSIVDILGSLFGTLFFAPFFLLLIILIDIEGANTKRKNKKKRSEDSSLNAANAEKRKNDANAPITKTYFGGAILGQERLGINQKPFRLFKFRSMTAADVRFDCENQTVDISDDRVTTIGKFIRRFKIDELLQLINVLRGEMSLVGPRPLLPVYAEEYDPWMKEKFLAKPGMTGLAQVNGGTYLNLNERSYFDVYYVRKANLAMDVKILFKTIAVIFSGEKKYKKDVSDEEIAAFIGNSFYSKE